MEIAKAKKCESQCLNCEWTVTDDVQALLGPMPDNFSGNFVYLVRCHQMSDVNAIKCTKFDFRWGSAPDPTGGVYSAPPDPLAAIKGPTSKGKGGNERGRKGTSKREDRRGKGKEGLPPFQLGTMDPAVKEGGKEGRQGGQLGFGRPCTSFFHLKH